MKTNKQEKLTIVVVDSGMGGLSICAELERGLKARHSHTQADLVYFNAWPEQDRGYNRLSGQEERIRVFDSALRAMEKLNPDLIMIACNTLSILFPETPFARQSKIPVMGIIDLGVKMAFNWMQENPESRAIILGTLMTVGSETHKKALVNQGIRPERIDGQPCDQLATKIESGPETAIVSEMINGFLAEAAGRIKQNGAPIYALLGCTHFGYARRLFEKWFKHHFTDPVIILNPNTAMSEHVLGTLEEEKVADTTVSVTVLSRITWQEEKVRAIADTISVVSPVTAKALINYRQDPNLFTV